MQFEEQLPRHRSPLTLAAHRDGKITFLSSRFSSSDPTATFAGRSATVRPHVHSCQSSDLRRTDGRRAGADRSIQTWREQDRAWRVIRAAMFGVSGQGDRDLCWLPRNCVFGFSVRVHVMDDSAGARGLRGLQPGDVSLRVRRGAPPRADGQCRTRSKAWRSPRMMRSWSPTVGRRQHPESVFACGSPCRPS